MIETLLWLLVQLGIIGLIFYVLWWGVSQIKTEPVRTIATVILVGVIVVVLVLFLVHLGRLVPHGNGLSLF